MVDTDGLWVAVERRVLLEKTRFVFGENTVPDSVLDAIRQGYWDFEPDYVASGEFDSTEALPGSHQKLEILARRVQQGLPLWHPDDRRTFDDRDAGLAD